MRRLAWLCSLAVVGSGTSGSSLAPVLFVGAGFSGLIGTGIDYLAPGFGVTSTSFAIVGAAATFGAAAGAPLTSIVLVIELRRDFDVVVPVMLATVVARLVASTLLTESLMTEKLARRGLWVPHTYTADAGAGIRVRSIMTPIDRSGRNEPDPTTGRDDALDLTGPTVSISADATLTAAAETMVGHEIATLLVVEDDQPVGQLDYWTVMRRLRPGHFDDEQDGWLQRFLDRRRGELNAERDISS